MGKQILVAEDESLVRMDLVLMLQDAGYEVIGEAGDGEKAIELAYQLKPDLIVMDIKMPKMNGLKASQIISKTFNIPILLLTAYSQKEFIDKAKQANIVGYLVKPVSEANLIPAVEIALNQGAKTSEYEKKIELANKKLLDRKTIEKAKGVLMTRFNLGEETAYNKMRQISMNKQMALEKVAKQILLKYGS
ncbi:response regulator NasT [Scopulibacillus daqui]|uniref:Response regulator NasT n=1 Tax=Scopulibacillus daqui TaxID=1469162 RepID=A0ABS2Q0V2_9BACL|nr:response regulator [Scopulibacillus daqui]MBM7645909.1 response regulator NasT [Scopulibacillus daqui]